MINGISSWRNGCYHTAFPAKLFWCAIFNLKCHMKLNFEHNSFIKRSVYNFQTRISCQIACSKKWLNFEQEQSFQFFGVMMWKCFSWNFDQSRQIQSKNVRPFCKYKQNADWISQEGYELWYLNIYHSIKGLHKMYSVTFFNH